MESSSHLFLSCNFFFTRIWYMMRHWIGLSLVDPFTLLDHFTQFSHLAGRSQMRCSITRIIWFSCIWIIWKEINDKFFKNQDVGIPQPLDKVKLLSFWWLKAKYPYFGFGYHN